MYTIILKTKNKIHKNYKKTKKISWYFAHNLKLKIDKFEENIYIIKQHGAKTQFGPAQNISVIAN